MKHLLLFACCIAIPSLYADDNEGIETQLLGRTDEEGNRRGLITGRKKFIQHGKRTDKNEEVKAQLLPRRTDEEGNKRSLITGRKKLRQHHTFNDEVELTDDEDVETQLLNRPVDEQGYQRSLVTGRRKLRQHHLIRSPEERQRDEEFGDKGQKPRYKRKRRVSREKYVEETPKHKRVVKQTTVKEEGRNWREYLPGQAE